MLAVGAVTDPTRAVSSRKVEASPAALSTLGVSSSVGEFRAASTAHEHVNKYLSRELPAGSAIRGASPTNFG